MDRLSARRGDLAPLEEFPRDDLDLAISFADNHEGQEASFQQRGHHQVLAVLFRRTPGPYQRDYYTSANYGSFRGVKDQWGRAGMTSRRKSWASV
jgi:hypothetical protein